MIALAAALAISTPRYATVDIIERNYVYASDGSVQFCQTMFWRFDSKAGRCHIVAYCYTGTGCMVPHIARERGMWVARWTDGGELLEVRAATYVETHTEYDIEVMDRKHVPLSQRRGLGL